MMRAQGWRALLGVAVIVLSSGLIEAGPVQKRSPGDDMKHDNQPNLLYFVCIAVLGSI